MKEKRSLLILLDLHSIQEIFHLRIPLTFDPSEQNGSEKIFFKVEKNLKTKKADQQYEVVERITTIEDENGEIMQKTNQVYLGLPCVMQHDPWLVCPRLTTKFTKTL